MADPDSDVESTPRAAPGRMPTMRDIADRLGVSRQLVSMVLRDLPGPSADSRERILAAAAEMGFRPHASARLLRQARSRLIGLIYDVHNPIQTRFLERLFPQSRQEDLSVVLGPLTTERSLDVAIGELLDQRVEALVAFNPDAGSSGLREAAARVPVVWLGEWTDYPGVDNIHIDEIGGFRLAVEHLMELGHRRLCYVGGLGGVAGAYRRSAVEQVAAELGVGEVDVVPTGFYEEDGAAAARALLGRDELPTAVLCSSDQCAAGLMAVLTAAGVHVPGDVSVVGFDDSAVAELSYLRLTSIRQDVPAMVDATLAAIVARADRRDGTTRSIATETTLVVRESTGAARG